MLEFVTKLRTERSNLKQRLTLSLNQKNNREMQNGVNTEDYFAKIQDKMFQCCLCGKLIKSSKRAVQNQHLRSFHKFQKPKCYNNLIGKVCNDCGKLFKNHFQVKKCIAEHTGKYDYSCEFCEKNFVLQQQYERHRRIHTKERPFQCTECGRRFNNVTHLKTHTRIHTGETPYSCDVCEKKFKFLATKRSHKCVPLN